MLNNDFIIQKRKQRFNWFVKIAYLLSVALIISGGYISYLEDLARHGGVGTGQDFNNLEPDFSEPVITSDGDFSQIKSLDLSKINQYLEQGLMPIPTPDDESTSTSTSKSTSSKTSPNIDKLETGNEILGQFNKLDATLASYKNTEPVYSGKSTINLTEFLTKYLKDTQSKVVLNEDLLESLYKDKNSLIRKNTDLKGKWIHFILDDNGNLNYLSYQRDRGRVIYIRDIVSNDFIIKTENKRSEYIPQVLEYRINQTLSNTMKEMGVDDATIRNVTQVFAKSGVAFDFSGARIRVYGDREFIEGTLVSDQITNVKAVQIKLLNGREYYAFYVQGAWVNERGDIDPSKLLAFDRYPFNGQDMSEKITSGFNPYRRHPITGRVSPHNGIDFGVPSGTQIYAPSDGVVVADRYQAGGAGHYLIIEHQSGFKTVYMHLNRKLVKLGDVVRRGQPIALSGNSGGSTGPHLHYEIHVDNRPVNPKLVELPAATISDFINRFKLESAKYKERLNDDKEVKNLLNTSKK